MMYEEDERAVELLEIYGLDRILKDNDLTIGMVITLLEDLNFLYLEMYSEEEEEYENE